MFVGGDPKINMTRFKKDRYKVLGPKNGIMQIILIEKQNPICFPPKYLLSISHFDALYLVKPWIAINKKICKLILPHLIA